MSDGRRHSVDIPLSKALVALRRVRSLRDPSTNSMSKFSALVDNLSWEANSCNGISLRFVNGCEEAGSDKHSLLKSPDLSFGGREEFHSDPELEYTSRKHGSKLISYKNSCCARNRILDSIKTKQVQGLGYSRSNGKHLYINKTLDEGGAGNQHKESLNLAFVPPSSNCLEGMDVHDKPASGSSGLVKIDPYRMRRKSRYKKEYKSTGVIKDVVGSGIGTPCESVSDARMDGSSRSTSVFTSEDIDDADYNRRGLGISCCWSGTPKSRESSFPSDVEGYPLLSGEVSEVGMSRNVRNCAYMKTEVDSPRSISQKFRPRSFNELVGHHVIARSLLSAISKGRIASLYLFHGPRGTGKTSASRIFAAALNCLSLEEYRPCGLCRECVSFFSGRSRDIKELDPARNSRNHRVRSLLRDAIIPPISSRFKVFIIDECHLLRGEAWATVLNSLNDLPHHVVFVMITPHVDQLPRSAVSRCQKYHFPKIKDADIAVRLGKICVEEGLEFEEVAMDFIAAKSDGSLRDAEMMLDQLSLLGKQITLPLVYELIGIVSDDEMLDLLDLAFSSDTSNTVRRARELMRSRVDPMQLISQLANLIMDILAGRYQKGTSKVGRRFLGRHNSEADLQKLRHALKILSETEKQLRTSKNQKTWLTVALLQLSSGDSSCLDVSDSRVCLSTDHQRDGGFVNTSSTGKSLKHSVFCSCDNTNGQNSEKQGDCKAKLDCIWKRTIERCQSNTLKSFLQKEAKLSSVCVSQGLAVAEVEFCRPDHVSRAEKSWKLIASALQRVLGCNVEIRINLVTCASSMKNAKVKKPSFSLLSCSRRVQESSYSNSEDERNQSNNSDINFEKAMPREEPVSIYLSDCAFQMSDAVNTVRNSEEKGLITGKAMSCSSFQDGAVEGSKLETDSTKEEEYNREHQNFSIQEPDNQLNCSSTVRLNKRLHSPDAFKRICLRIQPPDKLELPAPQKKSFEKYFCASDPYIFSSSSNALGNSSGDEDGPRKNSWVNSKVHCWRAPKFQFRKAWQVRQPRQRLHLVEWVLPCATAK